MIEPLAFRIRPKKLEDVKGQDHLIGENRILTKFVENKRLFSIIFYGPPGTGKTTLASALATELNIPCRTFNAVTGNKKDLDALFLEAKLASSLVVIIDEVHRLNKDKQDLLLPHIEDGSIIMIGATTSNPLFAINPAIRSRCQLLEVKKLGPNDIKEVLLRALTIEEGLNNKYKIEEDALDLIVSKANGDVRYALNVLDICSIASDGIINSQIVEQYANISSSNFDKDGDGHYDTVSAFQKSIRGSDVNAALYYLSRLAQAYDMDSIERRLLVIAYEDIGLGNPAAVGRTINAIDAAKRVGFPEAIIPLSVAVIDLTLSPKSKSAYNAINKAKYTENCSVPNYLKLNPVNIDEEDKYDYDRSELWPYIQYLPKEIKDMEFYNPSTNSSYESQLARNYEVLKKLKRTDNLKQLKKNFKLVK